jgi:hypothetical protein
MNWYNFLKFSEQGLWGQDVSKDLPLPDQGNRTLFDVNSIPNPPPVLFTGEGIIEDIGTNAQNCQDVQFLIDKYDASYNIIKWDGGAAPVYVIYNNEDYVVECGENGVSVSEANQWVYDIVDLQLDSYIPAPDFNQEFWDGVSENQMLYHATDSENVKSILKHGLRISSKTRGLSNRYMGDAIFTSLNPEAISSYGDSIIQINVGQMKQEGFMPQVSGEDPLSEDQQRETIAYKLGLEDFHIEDRGWEGLDPETVAFKDNIPPRFLTLYA